MKKFVLLFFLIWNFIFTFAQKLEIKKISKNDLEIYSLGIANGNMLYVSTVDGVWRIKLPCRVDTLVQFEVYDYPLVLDKILYEDTSSYTKQFAKRYTLKYRLLISDNKGKMYGITFDNRMVSFTDTTCRGQQIPCKSLQKHISDISFGNKKVGFISENKVGTAPYNGTEFSDKDFISESEKGVNKIFVTRNDSIIRCYYERIEHSSMKEFSKNIQANKIVEDKNRNIWILTLNSKLWRYDLAAKKWSEKFNLDVLDSILKSTLAHSMCADANEKIWISNFNYVFRYEGNVLKSTQKIEAGITSMMVDTLSNRVWVGTKKGLYFIPFDTTTQRIDLRGKIKLLSPTCQSENIKDTARFVHFEAEVNLAILSYRWDFGDKKQTTHVTNKASHCYLDTGTFRVKLYLTYYPNLVDSVIYDSVTIYKNPKADFRSKIEKDNPNTVSLSDISYIPAGGNSALAISKWHWEYGDGDSQTLYTKHPHTHSYGKVGEYEVRLIVESKGCKSSPKKRKITIKKLENKE